MQIFKASLLALPFFFACGGGGSGSSGLSDSEVVADLSIEEAEDLCAEGLDVFPERTVTCNGQSFPVGLTAEDCQGFTEDDLPPPGCPLTVGQYRDCLDAQAALSDAQLCEGTEVAACAPLEQAACE